MTDVAPWLRVLIEVELALLVAGGAVGIVVFFVIALRTVFDRSALVSPEEFREGRAVAERAKHDFEPDLAWPWYFRRQTEADGERIRLEEEAVGRRLWAVLGAPLFTRAPLTGSWRLTPAWLLVPYPLAVLPFLLGGLATTAACEAIALVVALAVSAFAWLVFVVIVGTLRGIEALWLRFRHTSASCPRCYYVGDRPAYRCGGCGALHRDIRPGRLGVFFRRCDCGEVMPTMVLRAAWSREAICQRCEEPLRAGAAAIRDVRVPIFGDVSAGKTRLLCASLDSIHDLAERNGIALSYPDAESQRLADEARATIRSSADTVKTGLASGPALSFRLGAGANSTLVHLFDVAGELYRDGDRYEDVSFLDQGHGLIFVVDPFTLPTVRGRLAGDPSAALQVSAGEGKDPDLAYHQVVSQLRDRGVKASSQRLAIVVSKADVLAELGVDFPTAFAEIIDWLRDNGLHNVVIAAPNEFAEVRYFAVASIPADRTTQETDPGAPLRWLLRAQGVPLPAEPQPVAIGEGEDE